MTTRNKAVMVLLASATAVGLFSVAYFAAQSRAGFERRRSDLTREVESLRNELMRSHEQRVTSRSTDPDAKSPAAPAANGGAVVAAQSMKVPPRTRPPGLSDLARNSPQLWNEFVASKKVEFARAYLPLLQRLNASAERRGKFASILADGLARSSDIAAAANAQGLEFDDPAVRALREESEERTKAELKSLLGPEGYREYDTFERAMPARGYVDGLAVQLAGQVPLSRHQAEQLEKALAESNPPFVAGGRADPAAMDWEAADRRVQKILTPEQFAVWQRGMAHSAFGGSRREQELEAVYQRAIKRAKEAMKRSEN